MTTEVDTMGFGPHDEDDRATVRELRAEIVRLTQERDEARAAEREACAQLCEESRGRRHLSEVAAAIRARSHT